MKQLLCILILLLVEFPLAAAPQSSADLQKLYSALTKQETSNSATLKIIEITRTSKTARNYFAKKIPALIQNEPPGPVWMNAVRLAGQLKIVEAVSPLVKAMSRGKLGAEEGGITERMRLDTDLVGKALAQIGDASVPSLRSSLRSGDSATRKRVALIVFNIKSKLSLKTLREHLEREDDPEVKKLIEGWLGARNGV